MNNQCRSLYERMRRGLLSFPVTLFDSDLNLDMTRYTNHVDWLIQHDVFGLFPAGGTGEFFSLSDGEIASTVTAAVDASQGRVPVIAPIGGSTSAAIEHARELEQLGADGALLFPPYLVRPSERGLFDHLDAVLSATNLPVIVYGRANAVPTADCVIRLAERHPHLLGYKDGVGGLATLTGIRAELGEQFLLVGGVPTAETLALAYRSVGATTYSSAMFNFAPDFAISFYNNVMAEKTEAVLSDIRSFIRPFVAMRDREAGYAVSIIKAGLDAVGRYGGPVRPPLAALTEAERADLAELLSKAL